MSAASGASVETAFTSQWVDDCHPQHSLFVVLEREPRNLSKAELQFRELGKLRCGTIVSSSASVSMFNSMGRVSKRCCVLLSVGVEMMFTEPHCQLVQLVVIE